MTLRPKVGVLIGCLVVTLCAQGTRGGDLCEQLTTSIEEGPTRTVIRVEWSHDLARVKTHVVRFAVPTAAGARARVLQIQVEPASTTLSPESVPVSPVELAEPGRFRGQWVASARVASHRRVGGRVEAIRSIDIEFEHPEGAFSSATAPRAEADPLLEAARASWANPRAAELFATPASGALKAGLPVEDSFARSENWLRVEIDRTGVHRIGYEHLAAQLGAARSNAIDPASLRLLSARKVLQPQSPSDPSGSWALDHTLGERAIDVRAAGTTLAPGDEILFYATGHEGWMDRYDPNAGRMEHFEHEFADHLAYWLSWEELGGSGGFPDPPLRMQLIGADPAGATRQFVDHRERLHLERNLDDQYGLVPDNWVWEARIAYGAPYYIPFDVDAVVPDSTATILTKLFARRPSSGGSGPAAILHATLNAASTPQLVARWNFYAQESYSAAPLRAGAGGLTLLEGNNVLRIDNLSELDTLGQNPGRPFLVVDEYQWLYRRRLVLRDGSLEWLAFPDEIEQSDRHAFALKQASGGLEGAILLDTTDPRAPIRLDGYVVEDGGRSLRFGRQLAAGSSPHFALATRAALLTPRALQLHTPRRLRTEVGARGMGWNFVALHPAAFAAAARRLADHRRVDLGGYEAPEAAAIDVQDIYDEFGHGVKEPAAIRNFLEFLWVYDRSIAYACLVGDASRDYRNRLPGAANEPFAPERDQLPTWLQTQYPGNYGSDLNRAYAADDWYGCMDDPLPRAGSIVYPDLPEIAMGRLPVGSPAEADAFVGRILDYERTPVAGRWRNTILMAADDEVALSSGNRNEGDHVEEGECISEYFLDDDFRVDKLFLTEFPSVAGQRAKPGARQALKDRWSDGRLIVHYIGHGSPTQMADENVFSIEDVGELRNGMKRALFLAFSCDVAIFDSPTTKSMSEQLVLARAGGAIATIAATEVTFIGANEDLTEAFYPNLFPVADARSTPVGLALILAKQQHPDVQPPNPSAFVLHNDQRYTLLGDPALRLQSPTGRATLTGDAAEAIRSGQIQSVGADLGGSSAGTDGNYFLDMRESARFVSYFMEGGSTTPLEYRLDGESFFKGQGEFSGQMSAQVLPPVDMRFGDHGRIELLLDTGSELIAAVSDDHPVVRDVVTVADERGPEILLGFQDGRRMVEPGSILRATIEDPSGINVLGTAPLNSILIETDDSGFPIDAASLFRLDEGSFTRGTLEYVLPSATAEGSRKIALSASDMLGNASRAEIEFDVVPAGTQAIRAHLAHPNPFQTDTHFVVDLTQVPQEVEISIFSSDGRPVRTLRAAGTARESLVLPWDGRDAEGDEIANGVYLYRVRARFAGEPALSQVRMGRIVRMR